MPSVNFRRVWCAVVLYKLDSLARMYFSWWRRKFTCLQADVFLQAWPLEARNFEFLLNLVNMLSWRYIYSVFNKLVGNNVLDEMEKKNHSLKLFHFSTRKLAVNNYIICQKIFQARNWSQLYLHKTNGQIL